MEPWDFRRVTNGASAGRQAAMTPMADSMMVHMKGGLMEPVVSCGGQRLKVFLA